MWVNIGRPSSFSVSGLRSSCQVSGNCASQFNLNLHCCSCMIINLGNKFQVGKEMKQACSTMWATLKMREVWQPTAYMYLSWALSPDIGEGKFYWFNDSDVGPGFSEVSIM